MENNSLNTTTPGYTAPAQDASSTEDNVSLIELFNMMISRWWLIVLLALVLGSGAYIYTRAMTIPAYDSTGTLYINTQAEQKSDDVNTVAISGARTLMPTYIEILQSKPFLQSVSDTISNRYSFQQIKNMTRLSAVDDTNLISITIECVDSHDAYLICSSMVGKAPSEITRVFEGGSVKVINSPEEPVSPVPSKAMRNGIIGMLAGIVIACAIIFLINFFDTRVKAAEELTNRYKMPILGEIPNLHKLS